MEYLLKASAVIAIFYVCYKVFLQRDTFFNTNRWYLLIGLVAAFTIPKIIIPIYVEYTPMPLQNFNFSSDVAPIEALEEPFNPMQLLPIIYLTGVAVFFIRFLIQLGSLAIVLIKNKKQKLNTYTYVETDDDMAPFSFFNWIVYNPKLFNKTELDQIITHEKVHAKQRHSIDILLTQLSSVVFWFNPIIWFYNKDLKQNLEFLADKVAVNTTNCKTSYQYTLLKASVPTNQLAVTNNFYTSLIKKRIVMLQKSKSKKINLLKYAVVIPILVLFLMSFNTETVYVAKQIENTNKAEAGTNIFINKISIITKDLSDDELNKIKKQLNVHEIIVIFSDIKRNSKNEIIQLTVKVKSNKGSGGATWKNETNPIPNIEIGETEKGNVIARTIDDSVYKKNLLLNSLNLNKLTDENNKSNKTNSKIKNIKEDFTFIITKNFTDEDLKSLSKEALSKGVTLKFSKIKRNSKNEIIAIKAEFKNENGNGNISFNKKTPIKPFTYYQNAEGFGFGSSPKNITYTIRHKIGSNLNKSNLVSDSLNFSNGIKSTDSIKIIAYGNNSRKINSSYTIKGDTILLNSNLRNSVVSYGKNRIISTDSIHFDKKHNIMSVSGNVRLTNTNNQSPLIILNGKKIPNEAMNKIPSENIYSINVIKNAEAISTYGKKGENGVVNITLKTSEESPKIVIGKPITNFNHLIIKDGKEISQSEMEKISPNTIESVTILKGEAAIEKYGDKAKDGVVLVTMKKSKWKTEFKIGHPMNSNKALIIIDGKEQKDKNIEDLDANKIGSVTVLKGEKAIKKYGNKGKDGAIEVTTKTFTIEMNNGNKINEAFIDEKSGSIILNGNAVLNIKEDDIGLIFINGKKSSLKKAKKISPDNIESMNVLKGESATKKYGKKAKNGVLEITTKKKN